MNFDLQNYTITIISFLSSSANAERLSTNLDNVFIKKIKCLFPGTPIEHIKFSISNTSNITIEKKIVLTVLDEDGDPIDNGSKNIEVVSMSGNFYEIKVSCSSDYTYGFRFE